MNTDLNTCNGFPFTYHAEYSTASINHRTPWAALEGGVLMEQEIGHSEVCSSLANQDPVIAAYPDGSTFEDDNTYDTCMCCPTRSSAGPAPGRRTPSSS
jgi:hypothetical protein